MSVQYKLAYDTSTLTDHVYAFISRFVLSSTIISSHCLQFRLLHFPDGPPPSPNFLQSARVFYSSYLNFSSLTPKSSQVKN